MTHPVNVILLSAGILQGLLLGTYLLKKQKKDLSGLYFILILLLAGLQLTFKVLSKVWLWEHMKLAYLLSYSLPFLAGPLLYLFVSARTKRPFSMVDLIHLAPFLLSVAGCIATYLRPYDSPIPPLNPYLAASIQVLSIAVYATQSWRLIQRNALAGLRSFVVTIAAAEAIISLALAVMYVYHPRLQEVRWVFLCLTALIYWMSYRLLDSAGSLQESKPQRSGKYERSSLKEEEARQIAEQLRQIMTRDRVYTDTALTIDILARQLNTSRHHLSQVINQYFGQRYHDLINEFRLVEARRRLESGRYSHYTVSAIALDCGFGAVSNFNELFKKRYGITPSQVRLQLAEKVDS